MILFSVFKSCFTNYFVGGVLKKGKGTRLTCCIGRHITKNAGNSIITGEGCSLTDCRFLIKGKNNKITIGNHCALKGVRFWMSGDNNEIVIDDYTTVGHNTEFATLEGTCISVGKDCMFSHDIRVRTSDSHSVLDQDGKRTNPAKDISIGNHVWIGLEVLILKGSEIKDNSVVAARSMVTKPFTKKNCLIAGAPAKELKLNINWSRDRK
ncbi:MAG: acyltransferase [Prevotella sp.]|nr:acyltransferase [Candidatus Prevotella equi]